MKTFIYGIDSMFLWGILWDENCFIFYLGFFFFGWAKEAEEEVNEVVLCLEKPKKSRRKS